MCGIYLIAAVYVLLLNLPLIPGMFGLIFSSAFSPTEAQGAFAGGTLGYAFLWGMKRALFSNEAGQGSAPIAHAAAKTDEPVREGVVAGLGPFIDTIVVCTLTAMVILISGAWNRAPTAFFDTEPEVVPAGPGEWTLASARLPDVTGTAWFPGQAIFMLLDTGVVNPQTASSLVEFHGTVVESPEGPAVAWGTWSGATAPTPERGIHVVYTGASLTSHAFDRVRPGLGRWLVTLASWLFAISTMISWSYYGEQGVVFLLGARWVRSYKFVYCLLIVVATSGFITTDQELDAFTSLGTGVMLFANIPIILIFSRQTMRQYHDYVGRLKSGRMPRTS
jgi:AGCS family alanine or glycine:cation symporter